MQQPYGYGQGYADSQPIYPSSGYGGAAYSAYNTAGTSSVDSSSYFAYPRGGQGVSYMPSSTGFGAQYFDGYSDGSRYNYNGDSWQGQSNQNFGMIGPAGSSGAFSSRTSPSMRPNAPRSSRARPTRGGCCKSLDWVMWSVIGIAFVFMLFRLRNCDVSDKKKLSLFLLRDIFVSFASYQADVKRASPLCYIKAAADHFRRGPEIMVGTDVPEEQDEEWVKTQNVKADIIKYSKEGNKNNGASDVLTEGGDDDGYGILDIVHENAKASKGKGKNKAAEAESEKAITILDLNSDFHSLVKEDRLFDLSKIAPSIMDTNAYENKAMASVRPASGRITVAVYLESSSFYNFVNFIMGFERLDEKSGKREVDPSQIFFVVYDVGCSKYHLQLLENSFLSRGRARPDTNLVVDTSLRSFFMDDKIGIKPLFSVRPVVFAKALQDYGFDSVVVIVVNPAAFMENDVAKLTEQILREGIVATSTPVLTPKKTKSDRKIKDWVHPKMIEEFKVSRELAGNVNMELLVPDGNLIAADMRNMKIMKGVIKPWLECSTSWKCIAPPGSSFANHLFDLSHLALLLDLTKLTPVNNPKSLGIDTSTELRDILQESLKDMWGHMKSLNSSRQAIDYTSFTHFAEVNLLQSHMFLNFITAANDEPSLRLSMDMMNRISEQERGTKRGNVNSFGSYQRPARLILYDMGMSSDLRRLTEISFKNAFGDNAVIVSFEDQIKKYPPHCQFGNQAKCYKPVLMNTTMSEYGGCVLWIEPKDEKGQIPTAKKKLDRIREYLARKGFVSVHAPGRLRSRVPEATKKQFGLTGVRVTDTILDWPAIDSNLVGVNSHNKTIVQSLFQPWLQCSLAESCIAPPEVAWEVKQFPRIRQFEMSALTAAFYASGLTPDDIAKKRNDLHISSAEPRDLQKRRRLFRRLFK